MKIRYSLKNVQTISFVVITIIPILIIGIIVLQLLDKQLSEEIQHKNLLLAKSLASDVNRFLDGQLNVVVQMSDILESQTISDDKTLNAYLQSSIKYQPSLGMIRILDNMGIVKHIAPPNRNFLGINMSYHRFVESVLKNHRQNWSSIFISPQTREPTLALSVPYSSGVIVGYSSLNKLNKITDNAKIGFSGYSTIIDRAGKIITHPDRSLAAEQTSLSILPEIRSDLNKGQGTIKSVLMGIEVYISTVFIPETSWYVLVIQSVEEALIPIQRIRNLIWGGILITLALSLCLVFYILKKTLGPISYVTKHSQKIAEGHKIPFTRLNSFYEVNELSKNFNLMIKAVTRRENEILESENRYRELFNKISSGVAVYETRDNGNDFLLLDFNKSGERIENVKKEKILGKSVQKVFPGIVEFGLLNVIQRVWETGKPEFYPDSFYKDDKNTGWRENYVYKLASGEVVAVYDDITNRKKAEEKIKASLKEKETLLQEIHHRVKNNLNVVSSLLSLQADKTDNDHAKAALIDSKNRVLSMSGIHETIYQSEDLSAVDMHPYLSKLIRTVAQNYLSGSKVKLVIETNNILIEAKQASTVGLIINELITNSYKHAFPDDREGEIKIQMEKTANQIDLTYKDSGIGIPKSLDWRNAKSMGINLLKLLSENQLNGTIDMENKNGTNFTIKFKIDA